MLAWRNDRHRAGRGTLYTALHVPYPGAVFRQQRQSLFVRFANSGLFFTEFRWLTGEKIRPKHRPLPPTAGRDFPRCTVPLGYYALHIFAAVIQCLSHGWNTCSGRILENGGNSKGVSNGLSLAQSWLKRLRKRSTGALHMCVAWG